MNLLDLLAGFGLGVAITIAGLVIIDYITGDD